jgi:hypothetical protein
LETWKIGRELRRLQQQLQAIPEFFYEPLLRRWHDARRSHVLRTQAGAVPASHKVAVYLVYQPAGIAESTLLTCDHLAAQGYAPLIVSNARLSPADNNRMLPKTWRIVERPNFGYDFGGYRDGIWLLDQWGERPESLILLNDSIWFPALEHDKSIAKMESMAADFQGVLKLGTGEGAVLRRGREPFLGSFFLMFSAKALQSDAFSLFWRQYQNTSNKYKTIRRGERRLSYVMRDAGFEGASLFDRIQFDQWLNELDVPGLRRLLDELVTIDSSMASMLKAMASAHDAADTKAQEAMRASMLNAINAATKKSNIFSTALISTLRDFAVPFIKKASDAPNAKALERLVLELDYRPGSLEITEVVENELRQLVASRQ